MACKVGQQIASAGGDCDRIQRTSFFDHTVHGCCEDKIVKYTTEETVEAVSEGIDETYDDGDDNDDENEIGEAHEECESDHGCEHKCTFRNNLQSCSCDDGHHLASDSKTCIKDEPAPGELRRCEEGFRKNHFGECVDINECDEDDDLCGSGECVNTEGSFKCKEVCSHGWAFDEEKWQCEGR